MNFFKNILIFLCVQIYGLAAQDLKQIAKYEADVNGAGFDFLSSQYLDLDKAFEPKCLVDLSAFLAEPDLDYIKIERLTYTSYENKPLTKSISEISYIYFNENKYARCSISSTYLKNNVSTTLSDTKYEYDEKKRLIAITTHKDTNFIFKKIKYINDSTTIITLKYNSTMMDSTIIKYNKEGLPILVSIYNSMSRVPNIASYEYNNKKQLIAIQTCMQEYFFKYDDDKWMEYSGNNIICDKDTSCHTKMVLSTDKKKANIVIKRSGSSPSPINAIFNKAGLPTVITREHNMGYEPYFVHTKHLISYNAQNYPKKITYTVFFKDNKKPHSKRTETNIYDDKNLLRRREINFKSEENEQISKTIITITPYYN